MIWLLCLASLAAEPRVEHTPAARPPAYQWDKSIDALPMPEVQPPVVDGDLSEWAAVAGPPLLPFSQGGPPPEVTVYLGTTADGLALGFEGLPLGFRAQVLLDPDGGRQRWHILTIDEKASVEDCGFEPVELAVDVFTSPNAAPCKEGQISGLSWQRVGEVVEVLWPWADIEGATTALSLGLEVTGPRGAGGTWSRSRGARLQANQTHPIAEAGARVAVREQLQERHYAVVLRSEPLPQATDWQWALWRVGEVVATGSQTLPADTARLDFTVPMQDLSGGSLVISRAASPIPVASSVMVFPSSYHARVTTPVFRDTIRVAWATSSALRDVQVELTDPAGASLRSFRTDLPRGVGELVIDIDPTWPDLVSVSVDEGMMGQGRAVRAAPP